jgi:hypothetical protein
MHKAVIISGMDDFYSGWWKKEVLVVPGRSNSKFQEFFKDGALGRQPVANGCHQGYHECRFWWQDDYSSCETDECEVIQEFDDDVDDDETYKEEYSGIPDNTTVDWCQG